jgi:hypothetical protein
MRNTYKILMGNPLEIIQLDVRGRDKWAMVTLSVELPQDRVHWKIKPSSALGLDIGS